MTMRGLGEEIAVLDGVDLPNYYDRGRVIDASAGANYSGGSSWPGDLPLTPSNAGLAGVDQDLIGTYDRIENYYNRGKVIDASAGANYSGGSSWPGDLPLTPSNAGLAGEMDTFAKNIAVPMEALLLQRYLVAIGVKLTPDGVWGKASEDAMARFSQQMDGGEFISNLADVKVAISPFARGRMVLIKKPEVLFKIINMMKDKARRGEALAGMPRHRIPGYYDRGAVIDASAGANYSGGSSWPGNLPLTPSNAGLAGFAGTGRASSPEGDDNDLIGYYNRGQVIDASAGANYSGGSSWPGNLPLTPSNAGLADYPGYYKVKGSVIDASAGANYSGGSSWPGNLPLTPSNAGLAGLGAMVPSDNVSDAAFKRKLYGNQISTFCRLCARDRVLAMKRAGMMALRAGNRSKAELIGRKLVGMRALRQNILRSTGVALPRSIAA
jgi:hypothetical protein